MERVLHLTFPYVAAFEAFALHPNVFCTFRPSRNESCRIDGSARSTARTSAREGLSIAMDRTRSQSLQSLRTGGTSCTSSYVRVRLSGHRKQRSVAQSKRRSDEALVDGGYRLQEYRRVLSIAGSDAGGGAGVQADLKTIGACRCYGMTAITALTAQNTVGVQAIHEVPPEFVRQQIDSVLSDIGADAIKIGMLHSAAIVRIVVRAIKAYSVDHVVVDPVMVTTSGDPLLQEEALQELKENLLPQASVITPNLPEAAMLMGIDSIRKEEMQECAIHLGRTLHTSVLLKGGHLPVTELADVLYNHKNSEVTLFHSKKIDTQNTHGTGCTLSSALASFLAHGMSLEEAVQEARNYLHDAIQAGARYHVGEGHGPVHHFGRQWT